MDKNSVLRKAEAYLESKSRGESTGHDYWHAIRVRNMAMRIAAKERGADKFIVQLAALLHDVYDYKINGKSDHELGPRKVNAWLLRQGVGRRSADSVSQIIREISFKGAGVKTVPTMLEGKIVQDADRLDALGAIGIGRTFATGARLGRELYDPGVKPARHNTFAQYMKRRSHTINHFYEKIFLLKGLMNTKTAKEIAKGRHEYTKEFVDRFLAEWDGEI